MKTGRDFCLINITKTDIFFKEFLFMKKLTEIANIALTDKGTVKDEAHAYTEFYNDIFEQYKNTGKKINILEIGVDTGASLKMFNMFFDYNCEIYALDIDLSKNTYQAENVHLYHVNQNNKQEIENFLANINNIKFDIILDDGSHQLEHQIHSLLYLYKSLSETGIYILEDLHTYKWGRIIDSPLYYLSFYGDNSFLTKEENYELQNAIQEVTIHSRKNSRIPYCIPYCGRSITSIIKFNHN